MSNKNLASAKDLIFGDRAEQFDAFCQEVPRLETIRKMQEALGTEVIKNIIFDLDGTLVRPNTGKTRRVGLIQKDYKRGGIEQLFLMSHKSDEKMDRISDFEKMGFKLIEGKKPSLKTFQDASEKYKFNPEETAMIGNFPITDMPLTENDEDAYLGLNILVESIPPNKKDFKSTKDYMRILFFHSLAVLTSKIVLRKNNDILHFS